MRGLLNANAAFSPGKASQVPAEEETGWVQSRSSRSEAEKTSWPAPGIEAHLFGLPARYTVTTPTEPPISLHSHTLKPSNKHS